MQAIYEKHHDSGFEILAFPCNQFGKQEPGTDEEILEFATSNYGVTFQMFSKIKVNGDNAHPLYKYLKSQKSTLFGKSIKWNFTHFLVNKEGEVVDRFGGSKDLSPIDKAIEELL